MAAIRIAGGYITKGPPWAKRWGGLKLGKLGWGPGETPPHLQAYFFKEGEIKPIVEKCRTKLGIPAGRKGGPALVKCIFTEVGNMRRKG